MTNPKSCRFKLGDSVVHKTGSRTVYRVNTIVDGKLYLEGLGDLVGFDPDRFKLYGRKKKSKSKVVL